MRKINRISRLRNGITGGLALSLVLILPASHVCAEKIIRVFPVEQGRDVIETGLGPLASGSDSIYCGDVLLASGIDYDLVESTGRLFLLKRPECDSITVKAFTLPGWLVEPVGNPVPRARRSIRVESPVPPPFDSGRPRPQKIELSGNKSFSFAVGRSGEGQFSQGMNIDFDALLATDLRVRGSISDGIGSAGTLTGAGGTALLSELDKYFLEVDGRHFDARAGDIKTASSSRLPPKRIKGIYGGFENSVINLSTDIGRPAGRFVSQNIRGSDGGQGPYQLRGSDGRPTAVVPGSEKIYVDGQLLKAGADRHYVIDYAFGRIVFSPQVLITSRSRIEADFEAAENDYEQLIFDVAGGAAATSGRFAFSAGFRRESDEKDRLRFGSYSQYEIGILEGAGDDPELAQRNGAVPSDSGAYILVSDTTGNSQYRYVGSGNGDLDLSFSLVGEGKGDYRYLGDGVYEYVGQGEGDYLPIVYFPLPARNDQFFATSGFSLFPGSRLNFEYEGNRRDGNLFSDIDDDDNYAGLYGGRFTFGNKSVSSGLDIRFRQDEYVPLRRINKADFARAWALPGGKLEGDELLIETAHKISFGDNRIDASAGYLKYSQNLRSGQVNFSLALLDDMPISPRLGYRRGNSEKMGKETGSGLFEKINPGVSVKPIREIVLEFAFDREFTKDLYGEVPDVERYDQYRGSVFFRSTTLSLSRRTERRSDLNVYRGPRLDKVEISSDESIGRVRFKLLGTWLDQKRLDSDRPDRRERLYQAALSYTPASGWLSVTAEYRQNRQSARTTGFRYIPVESGTGDYRFEDGEYLADPDGDYIRIREEIGDATSVTTGDKSHNIILYPGRLVTEGITKKLLSQIAFRLRTEISEESPGKDPHHLSWILPWVSHSGLDYLNRKRREGYSLLLFPEFNFYRVNLAYSHVFEEQQAGEQINRSRKKYETEIKQQLDGQTRMFLKWQHFRDNQAGSGLVSLRMKRNEYSGGLIVNQGGFQITPEAAYSRFEDELSGGSGRGVMLGTEAVYRRSGRGEIRFNMQLRSLTEKRAFSQPEYLITDGRRFGKSARLGLNTSYDIGRSMRLTVNITDNVFENRPAEFNGRGELVARF